MTPNRHRELKYFCLQYSEKNKRIKELVHLANVVHDGMAQDDLTSNQTAEIDMELKALRRETLLIEQTARAVGKFFYQGLLDNVTNGVSWEKLDIPMSRRGFSTIKKVFFTTLAQNLDNSE